VKSVGVRELRDNLRMWLDLAKKGETIVVTERGKPVAHLGPADQMRALMEMVARGEATLPTKPKRPARLQKGLPLRGTGPSAVEIVRDQRR